MKNDVEQVEWEQIYMRVGANRDRVMFEKVKGWISKQTDGGMVDGYVEEYMDKQWVNGC